MKNEANGRIIVIGDAGRPAKAALAYQVFLDFQQEGIPITLLTVSWDSMEILSDSSLNLLESVDLQIVIPRLNHNRCQQCGRCSRVCEHEAIIRYGTPPAYIWRAEVCQACQACLKACGQREALKPCKVHAATCKTHRHGDSYVYEAVIEGQRNLIAYLEAYLTSLPTKTAFMLHNATSTSGSAMEKNLDWADLVILVKRDEGPDIHRDIQMLKDKVRTRNLPFLMIGPGEIPDVRQILKSLHVDYGNTIASI